MLPGPASHQLPDAARVTHATSLVFQASGLVLFPLPAPPACPREQLAAEGMHWAVPGGITITQEPHRHPEAGGRKRSPASASCSAHTGASFAVCWKGFGRKRRKRKRRHSDTCAAATAPAVCADKPQSCVPNPRQGSSRGQAAHAMGATLHGWKAESELPVPVLRHSHQSVPRGVGSTENHRMQPHTSPQHQTTGRTPAPLRLYSPLN